MGGKTLYFGEIGHSSKTLISYFERSGARPCGQDENPAEWMFEVTGAIPGTRSTQDWSDIWSASAEYKVVKAELARMKETLSQQSTSVNDSDALRPFAASFSSQLWAVLMRIFQQYWRTPSYLYSKVALCFFSVSLPHSNASKNLFNFSSVNVHWIFFLENAQLASRTSKSAFRRFHIAHYILQFLSTNHASFRDPTRFV